MTTTEAKLYLLCGKIASGKSTLARKLAENPATVLVCEDEWLSTLYPDELKTLQDYVRCSGLLRAALGPHVIELLRSGLSVVMDFPANTLEQRQWLRSLFEQVGVSHEMHYLDVDDATCKTRLRQRNQAGDHAFQVTDAQFDQFTKYFVRPAPDENFNLINERRET